MKKQHTKIHQLFCFLAGLIIFAVSLSVWAVNADQLQDPTKPYDWGVTQAGKDQDAEEEELPELKLSSIIYSVQRRLAIINGQMVKEGDVVDQAKVIRIKPKFVLVNRYGESMTLTGQSADVGQAMSVIKR